MANVVTLGAARELGVPEDAATRDIEPVKKDVYAFATLAAMEGASITAPDGLEDELRTVVKISAEVRRVLADAGWVEAFDMVRQKRFVQSEARLQRFVDGPHCE
jgi:hypothetical protein